MRGATRIERAVVLYLAVLALSWAVFMVSCFIGMAAEYGTEWYHTISRIIDVSLMFFLAIVLIGALSGAFAAIRWALTS